MTEQEQEREREDDILAERAVLDRRISEARASVTAAMTALGKLHQLYDVEVVEGTDGADVDAFLTEARRALTAADALQRSVLPY